MDLTLKVTEDTKLNIRVAIIMETENGFVFTQNKTDTYYYAIGGRAQLNESSITSAIRELEEEAGITLPKEDLKLVSIIENFWKVTECKVHEINFVFTIPKQEKIGTGVDSHKTFFHEIKKEDLKDLDIRPSVIKDLILEDKLNTFTHLIV